MTWARIRLVHVEVPTDGELSGISRPDFFLEQFL